MSLAKKLREVVAANFIEIARVDTPPAKLDNAPVEVPSAATSEAELDLFLKDMGASVTETAPAASEVAPEPEPLKPAPVLAQLTDAVNEAGEVDFGRVFKQYELPTASFSAEQAMNMLQALPRDLPLRTKRVTVNTTLSAIGQVVGATPKDIVSDAVSKKATLEQYIEALKNEVDDANATTQAEIERLEAEIAANQEKIKELSKKKTAAIPVCQERMNLLNQVVSFFDYDENTLNAPEPVAVEDIGADPDDMPAFMREDAVRRMLGINEEFIDENGDFDAVKFAEKYGDDAEVPNGTEEVGAGRAPSAKK